MITKQISSNIPAQAIGAKSAVSGTNADVAISIALGAAAFILIHAIQFSYTGGTVTGELLITDGTLSFDVEVTSVGAVFLNGPIPFTADVTATLKAGGSGVTGKLNLQYTLEN